VRAVLKLKDIDKTRRLYESAKHRELRSSRRSNNSAHTIISARLYENREEHYGVAIPFMQIGLDRGEKCIYIADDGTVGEVRQAMQSEGIDVERATASKPRSGN